MTVDEQVSIGSILVALETSNVSDVAKQIEGISKDPLAAALNVAGYRYSSAKPKGWKFAGEGDEPLDKSIFDYVKRSSPLKKSNSPKVHKPITKSNTDIIPSNTQVTEVSPAVHSQFTKDEVNVIRQMLSAWTEAAPAIGRPVNLHERVKQLPKEEKVRKTIVIDTSIGERFDAFCDAERLNKSDILHLALADFLDAFE